jgi:phosphoglycerate dehydrogenase-like enzyme
MSASDVIIAAVPVTPYTRGLLGPDVLRLARPGTFMVNVGRGSVVEEEAVADATTTCPSPAISPSCSRGSAR